MLRGWMYFLMLGILTLRSKGKQFLMMTGVLMQMSQVEKNYPGCTNTMLNLRAWYTKNFWVCTSFFCTND